MCKSKSVISTDQLLEYVVILEKNATPKLLKDEISFDLINFKRNDEELNQWALDFNEDLKKAQKIKTALLNHPKVVSVFTKAQFDEIRLKKGKKTSEGSLGRERNAKQ